MLLVLGDFSPVSLETFISVFVGGFYGWEEALVKDQWEDQLLLTVLQ